MTKMGIKSKAASRSLPKAPIWRRRHWWAQGEVQKPSKPLAPLGIIAAIVIAVIALSVAVVKAAYDLTKFAVEAGDAARSMGILMEAAGGSAAAGKEMGGMVKRLRNDFAGSREEIAGMVLELRRSGLAGKDLESTVRLAGIATKTMGDAAGGILKRLDRSRAPYEKVCPQSV